MEDNISFIIPAYNCEDTLTNAVVSIYEKQNFNNGDEVIIVNDASTDNTQNVIDDLKRTYPPLVALKHNINKGSAAAGRNTGIDASKNDLIFCLDADNILAENSIPDLKNFLVANNLDAAAFGGIKYFKNYIENTIKEVEFSSLVSVHECLNFPNNTPCPTGNYLIAKRVWKEVGRYDEYLGGAYDSWSFGFKLLINRKKFETLPKTRYYHRIGYESTYVREVSKYNTSMNLLRVLLPYIDRINKKDVNYIFSKKGRNSWWEKKNKRPVRIIK